MGAGGVTVNRVYVRIMMLCVGIGALVPGCAQTPKKSLQQIEQERAELIQQIERTAETAQIRMDDGDYEKALQIIEKMRGRLPQPEAMANEMRTERWEVLGDAARLAYRLPVEAALKQGNFKEALQLLDNPDIAKFRILEDKYFIKQISLAMAFCPDSRLMKSIKEFISQERIELRRNDIFRIQRAFEAGRIHKESGGLRKALERLDALRSEIVQRPENKDRERLLVALNNAYDWLDLTPTAGPKTN